MLCCRQALRPAARHAAAGRRGDAGSGADSEAGDDGDDDGDGGGGDGVGGCDDADGGGDGGGAIVPTPLRGIEYIKPKNKRQPGCWKQKETHGDNPDIGGHLSVPISFWRRSYHEPQQR